MVKPPICFPTCASQIGSFLQAWGQKHKQTSFKKHHPQSHSHPFHHPPPFNYQVNEMNNPQDGPLPVVNGLLTLISSLITPTYPCIGGYKPNCTTVFVAHLVVIHQIDSLNHSHHLQKISTQRRRCIHRFCHGQAPLLLFIWWPDRCGADPKCAKWDWNICLHAP